jgi:hydroxymethylglutaryl-CoA lyase
MSPSARIRITEVGPRDGLQNEARAIATDQKVRLVNLLSACGFAEIEVSSFVSATWIPQLGDAAEVFAGIERRPVVIYSALVPNERGLDAALEARVGKIALFTAASETFTQRNTNAAIAQTLQRFAPVIARARAMPAPLPVRAYISCAVACPYEGPTNPARVRDLAAKLLDLGVDEIDVADTIGAAHPADIERVYDALDGLLAPGETTLHLHDTHGRAVACAERAMALGVTSFDASCAGLGGCPYAPGAAGNLATEDLAALAERLGRQHGLNLDALRAAAGYIAGVIDRPLRRVPGG